RLLQTINYPPEEPYDEVRAKSAEASLVRFFVSNGYFQAKVQTQTQLDSQSKLANLTYQVTLGKQAKYGPAQVPGLKDSEAKEMESTLRSWHAWFKGAEVKKGKSYSPTHLRNGITYLSDKLASHGLLAAQVRLQPPEYDPATNRAAIMFSVTPG